MSSGVRAGVVNANRTWKQSNNTEEKLSLMICMRQTSDHIGVGRENVGSIGGFAWMFFQHG